MRRILVTGANRGLGLEFVRQSLQAGDRVIACCRHPGQAGALNALVAQHPNRLHVLPLDVASQRSRDELLRELPLVGDGLDCLINNAGMLPSGERFGQVDARTLSTTLDTNAVGPFALTQMLAPILAAGRAARVANVSSTMGSIARADAFRAPSYAISKAALNMATVLLARHGAAGRAGGGTASGLGAYRHGRQGRRAGTGRFGARPAQSHSRAATGAERPVRRLPWTTHAVVAASAHRCTVPARTPSTGGHQRTPSASSKIKRLALARDVLSGESPSLTESPP